MKLSLMQKVVKRSLLLSIKSWGFYSDEEDDFAEIKKRKRRDKSRLVPTDKTLG